MAKDDIIDTLKDGVGLAGRMAARGVGEVSKALKPSKEPRGVSGETGLYYQRHLHPIFGSLVPFPEYLEYQQPRRAIAGYLKNLTIPAAERAFMAGSQSLLRGQTREARDKMAEAFTKDAQFADAYFLHGALCLEAKDYADAVHSLKKVLLCQSKLASRMRKYLSSLRLTLCLTENSSFAIYPDMLGVSLLLSIAHRGNGDDDESPNVLEQLLGVMPDHPVVGFFLACHYIEADRWYDVVTLLKDTLPEDNISLANLILLGKACMHTGDAETAVEIFRKIMTRTDFDPQLMVDVRYNLGTALALRGRSVEAEDEFNRITSQYPGYMDMLERLGLEVASRKKSFIPPPGGRGAPAVPVVEPGSPAREVPPPAQPPPPPSPPPPAQAPSTGELKEVSTVAGPAHLVSGDGKVHHLLANQPVSIGREEGDIVLSWDSAASRLHARVLPEEGGWWVEDAGSTNGTYINGYRINARVLLNRGDVLTIGHTQFQLQ